MGSPTGPCSDGDATRTTPSEPPTPRDPDDDRDEGGDPACWAHLFADVDPDDDEPPAGR